MQVSISIQCWTPHRSQKKEIIITDNINSQRNYFHCAFSASLFLSPSFFGTSSHFLHGGCGGNIVAFFPLLSLPFSVSLSLSHSRSLYFPLSPLSPTSIQSLSDD
jgi:hypothetical protein